MIWGRLASHAGFTATTAYFVMDVAAIWIDIVRGQRERGLIYAEAAAVPLFSLRDPRPARSALCRSALYEEKVPLASR